MNRRVQSCRSEGWEADDEPKANSGMSHGSGHLGDASGPRRDGDLVSGIPGDSLRGSNRALPRRFAAGSGVNSVGARLQ